MAKTAGTAGFTLIDLMIALAIIAIVTSFAVTTYRGYLQRGHRIEAVQGLMAAAAEQEKFHLAHGHYSDRFEPESDSGTPGLPVAPLTPSGHYRLQVQFADAASYRIAAMPAGGHADSICERLMIDESGRRVALDQRGHDSTARCW